MATVAKSDRITIVTLASAIAGPFDLTFRMFDDDGLSVFVNGQPRDDFSISSHYVDGFDDNATILFDSDLEIGDVVQIYGDLNPGRANDYQNGPGLTEAFNIEFGRIWSAVSEVKRDTKRSFRFFDTVSPIALQPGRYIVTNDSGTGITFGPTVTEILEATEISQTSAAEAVKAEQGAALFKNQAQVAALAAGAPLVVSLSSPVPYEDTIEILQTGAGSQVWQVISGVWEIVGWLSKPVFNDIADMAAAKGLIDGQGATVESGAFGQREHFDWIAGSTLPADGALVVDGVGGQWVSKRTVYADWAEFRSDVRSHPAGTMLLVQNLGWYEVVASGGNIPGADAFAASRKALPLPWGGFNLKQFGAVGDGVTDDFDAIQYAIDACVQGGHALFVPQGTFIIGESSEALGTTLYLSNITADKQGLTMEGAGRGKSIFKEKDGKTAANGRFTKMFYCWTADGVGRDFEYGSFTFRDITFDKNGRSNGTPPTEYEWEGAHIIAFQGGGTVTPSVDAVTLERVEFVDKIGAGIVFGPTETVARSIRITDLQSTYHPSIVGQGGPIGQKGCIECAGDADLVLMSGVNALYTQFEPTAVFDPDRVVRTSISDCKIDVVEMTYTQSSGGKSNYFLQVNNLTCLSKFLTRGCFTNVTNSRIKVTSEFYDFRLSIDNSTILLPYDEATGAVTPFYTNTPANWTLTVPQTFVSNSEFLIDYGQPIDALPVAATGYAVRANNVTDITRAALQVFENCTFDPRLAGTMDSYSTGGRTTFSRCKVAGASGGHAFVTGAFSSFKSSLNLIDNDFSEVGGNWLRILQAADGYTLKVSGNYSADEFAYNSSNIALVLPANFPVKPALFGTAAPTTGTWPKGQRVQNQDPDVGEAVEWLCTTGGVSGTWTPGFVLA